MFEEDKRYIFSASQELGPERQSRARHILGLEQKGIAEDSDTLGYIPATVQQVEELIETGFLTDFHPFNPQDINFFPTKKKTKKLNLPGAKKYQPLWLASQWAVVEAEQDALLEKLGGLNALKTRSYRDAIADLFSCLRAGNKIASDNHKQFLIAKFNLVKEQLDELILQARQHKGFVITFSARCLDKFHLQRWESPGDGDVALKTEHGLPLEYLSGLKSLGGWEKAYFKGLRGKVGN